MMTNDVEIYKYLREINCCKSCCLRYLGCRNSQTYLDIKSSLSQLGIEECSESLEPPHKQTKENVCVTCLDLLKERTTNDILKQIEQSNKFNLYDNINIVCALSLPICINLRALSVWLSLINKFPSRFSKTVQPDVPLKEVWKFIFGPKLSEFYKITLATKGTILTVELEFENEDEELEKLIKSKPDIFNSRRNEPKKYRHILTRKFFENNITPEHISFEEFDKYCNLPPSIPDFPLKIKNISILGDTLFIAGRYNKFSRSLCQTPWIIDGKRMAESSVQEIIEEPVIKLFKCDKNLVHLISSGREDVDVRCLGLGRPFVLELQDVQYTKVTFSQLRDLENTINKCPDLRVRDLQLVNREDVNHIKQGEENKTKQYRALCLYNGQNNLTNDMISILNKPDGFLIQQKTPIRVLHRRSMITRPRFIHNMKATLILDHPNLFYLDVVTQAGTYVKELVHGDFGRTIPNIKDLLTCYLKEHNYEDAYKINVDIVALDVTAIDLDWPPHIDIKTNCQDN